jgi:hypothetical protein
MFKSLKVRATVVCVVALVAAMLFGIASPASAAGNANNAKLCQKGGWKNLVRADQTAFKNQGACVSYAAHGGTLTPKLPDLVALLSCDTSGCSVRTQNIGVGAANGQIGWSIDISEVGHPGNLCSGSAAISLAPGATSSVLGSCSGIAGGTTPIAAVATATVDTSNAIAESNETNNTATLPFVLLP